MQRLGQYALSLVATAMICGILLSFFREGTVKNILRMVCGIMMIPHTIRRIFFTVPSRKKDVRIPQIMPVADRERTYCPSCCIRALLS